MKKVLNEVFGPRVPSTELQQRGARYAAPAVVLFLARFALLLSIFLPYWHMDMQAPQYPDGLSITAYVNRLEGDVREIDSLNHYIGMRPLGDAGQLERSLSIASLIAMVLFIEGAMYIHSKWAALLAIPAVMFPVVFLADLWYWMNDSGQNLDPTAAMSSSIKPFTPPVLGSGRVGQFETYASMGAGLQLAFAASVLTIIGLYLHRRAYKPLVDSARAQQKEHTS